MVRTSDKTMTFPDKTNNMYRLSNNQYNILLKIFIASTYKKPNNNIKKKINIIKKYFITQLFYYAHRTPKNFKNNPSVLLINPAKNEIGRLSRFFVEAINNELKHKLNMIR